MEKVNYLLEDELEIIQGGSIPWSDLSTYFNFGEGIGRWLAHQPTSPVSQPKCYNYGPAYPAPVLPCR